MAGASALASRLLSVIGASVTGRLSKTSVPVFRCDIVNDGRQPRPVNFVQRNDACFGCDGYLQVYVARTFRHERVVRRLRRLDVDAVPAMLVEELRHRITA